LNFDIKKGNF